jgi:hypothetical protein
MLFLKFLFFIYFLGTPNAREWQPSHFLHFFHQINLRGFSKNIVLHVKPVLDPNHIFPYPQFFNAFFKIYISSFFSINFFWHTHAVCSNLYQVNLKLEFSIHHIISIMLTHLCMTIAWKYLRLLQDQKKIDHASIHLHIYPYFSNSISNSTKPNH